MSLVQQAWRRHKIDLGMVGGKPVDHLPAGCELLPSEHVHPAEEYLPGVSIAERVLEGVDRLGEGTTTGHRREGGEELRLKPRVRS
jgi:hypothetical protein